MNMSYIDEVEMPMSLQIFGSEKEALIEAARKDDLAIHGERESVLQVT